MKLPMTTSAPIHPASSPIPVDLFVSKKHPGLPRGVIGFADSSGKIVFSVDRQSSKSSSDNKMVLLDSAGNPLISICRHHDGSWQGFKGDNGEKEFIFKVQRILNKFTTMELEVFLVAENQGELTCDFKVKGCHFQRSCTIYKGDSIVAQTGLMYKLRQIYVRRNNLNDYVPTIDGESFGLQRDHRGMAAEVVIWDGELAMIVGERCERTKTDRNNSGKGENKQFLSKLRGNFSSSMISRTLEEFPQFLAHGSVSQV